MRLRALLFGPVSAALFVGGIVGLGLLVPGYSAVRQTVSEIGEVGSPMRGAFTALLCAVAACLLAFAWGLREVGRRRGRSALAAYVAACAAVSAAGVGVFSFPNPLHNVFGQSELIGYQAPLCLALSWRREPWARRAVVFSWLMAVLIDGAILFNLASLAGSQTFWNEVKPVYGLIQRSLFLSWFAWCAGAGLLLRPRSI